MTSLISADSDQSFTHNFVHDAEADGHEQEAVSSTHVLLNTLFEAALLCIDGKIAHANPAACTLFAMPQDALAGKCVSDCIAIKDNAKNKAASPSSSAENSEQAAILLRPAACPVEVVLREVSLGAAGGAGPRGGKLLFVRQQEEEASSISGRALMDLLPWPMMRVDSGLNYLQGNAALARKLAPFVQLSEGQPLSGMGWPAAFCHGLNEAIASLKADAGTHRLLLEWQVNRRRHRFIAELIPEHDPHGVLRSVVAVMHDTSTSKEEEASSRLRDAQTAREHALAASHARDAFFGWVSHELRTPLNGIHSWAQILETCVGATSDSPLVGRALHGIRTGITQQLRLIEELVDVSRVIQGKLPLTRHTFALAPVARSAVESVRASALARRVHLDCRYPAEDALLKSDPCRVQQALHLLLSHASEKSPQHGTVSFSILRRRRHAAICITHCCSENASHANQSDGNRPVCQKDSRQLMNLLLARCLTERLGGKMTTRLSRKGGKIAHTLLLPLPGSTDLQDS